MFEKIRILMIQHYWLSAFSMSTLTLLITSVPNPPTPNIYIPHIDKIVHGLLYLILGISYLNAASKGFDFINTKSVVTAILASFLFGALDEFHQLFIPGRTGDVLDWAADCTGTLTGIFAFIVKIKTDTRRKNRDL